MSSGDYWYRVRYQGIRGKVHAAELAEVVGLPWPLEYESDFTALQEGIALERGFDRVLLLDWHPVKGRERPPTVPV